MSFNSNTNTEIPSIKGYNCRLYIPSSINPVSAMNFIFVVTIDMAIYNNCIRRCTFNHLSIQF